MAERKNYAVRLSEFVRTKTKLRTRSAVFDLSKLKLAFVPHWAVFSKIRPKPQFAPVT